MTNTTKVSVYGREFTIEVQADSVIVSWGNYAKATLSRLSNGRVNQSDMFYQMGDVATMNSRKSLAGKINRFIESLNEQEVEAEAEQVEEMKEESNNETKEMTLYHFVGLPTFNTFEVKEHVVTNQVKYFETVEWFQRFPTKKENVVHNEMGRIEVFTTDASMLETLRKRFTSRLNREHNKRVVEEGVTQAEQREILPAVNETAEEVAANEPKPERNKFERVAVLDVFGRSYDVIKSENSIGEPQINVKWEERGFVKTSTFKRVDGEVKRVHGTGILAEKAETILLEKLDGLLPKDESTESEENDMTTESNLCPTCGEKKLYPEGPRNALSRIDNKTQVCVQCGTEEALAPVMHNPLQFKREGRYELAKKTMDDIVKSEGPASERMKRLNDLQTELIKSGLFAASWVERETLSRLYDVGVPTIVENSRYIEEQRRRSKGGQ